LSSDHNALPTFSLHKDHIFLLDSYAQIPMHGDSSELRERTPTTCRNNQIIPRRSALIS
jgi:hypothetical protein